MKRTRNQIKSAKNSLDKNDQISALNYNLIAVSADKKELDEKESHKLR